MVGGSIVEDHPLNPKPQNPKKTLELPEGFWGPACVAEERLPTPNCQKACFGAQAGQPVSRQLP